MKQKSFDIGNLSLASNGRKKIEWAASQMPVLKIIREDFKRSKPLGGIIIGACLHVTSETANLMLVLKEAGAKVALCASNPLSTQDEVAASLVKDFGISVFAIHGEDNKTYYQHIEKVLDFQPQITMDDGADLINSLHKKYRIIFHDSRFMIHDSKNKTWEFFGSSEETTTGVIRLKAMARQGALKVPVIAVNDSDTKYLFDNRYGTGQSTLDGIMRATNLLIAGKNFVVVGFGWCGRGLASRARGMGAQVIVTEVDSVRALEAVMDGFTVMPIKKAAKIGDVFVTVTGNKNVISFSDILVMKDGVILANSGHFNVEIAIEDLEKKAKAKRKIREYVTEYTLDTKDTNLPHNYHTTVRGSYASGKRIYVLAEGRLVNLVAAEGHPAEVMDMSFANQALAALYLVKHKGKLKPRVYTLPKTIDQRVARLKLRAMGLRFDRLTSGQRKYLRSWQEGT